MDEIYEILNSYKSAIDVILERLDALDGQNKALNDQVNSLHSMIFDEILEPARQLMDADEKNRRFAGFKEKFDGQLGGKYNDIIRAREGDPEFDLTRNAFDTWDDLPAEQKEGVTEEKYVEDLIKDVDESISQLKESLGIPADKPIEIKQDENGTTSAEVDGQKVAEETATEEVKTEPVAEKKVESAPPAEEDGQGLLDFSDDEEKKDDPEEIKKYEEELAKLIG